MATTTPNNSAEIKDRLGDTIGEVVKDAIFNLISSDAGFLDEIKAKSAGTRTPGQKVQDGINVILNNGRTRMGVDMSFKDYITSNEIKPFIPQIISNIIQMPQEPTAQLYKRLTPINIPENQVVSFPSIGGLPEAEDMGEAEQYPTMSKFEMQGSMSVVTGKVGLKVSFTDDAWKLSESASQFHLLGILLGGLGKALERTKERKAANFLLRQGRVAFDNITAGARRTTGRDSLGVLNGTMTAGDIIQVWSEMLADGFMPDLMIIHPLAFPMFLRDPELRSWTFQNGGAAAMSKIWQTPQGNSGFQNFAQNVPQLHRRHDAMTELSNMATKAFPNQLPFMMEPLVTPYGFYSAASGNYPAHVDIIIADSRYLGYLVNQGGVNSGEWVTPETDFRNFKVSEKYAFATELNGAAIRVIRGVPVDKYAFDFVNKFSYVPTFDDNIDLDGFPVGDTIYGS